MEHTCLSTFILCFNLFLKLITSQRKHYNIFREVEPEPLKLLLLKKLNQLDICTNESRAMAELKLFLHKSGNGWVWSDGLAVVLRTHNFHPFEHSLNPPLWLSTSLGWNWKFYCITLWGFDALLGAQWRCRRDWRVPAQSWGSSLYLGEEQSSFLRRALESFAAFLFFIRTGGTTSIWAVRREVIYLV